jgi:hypothetical protein
MPWDLSGNSGTSTSSFLGTIDVRPLVIKTNGAEAMRVTSEGRVSIGSLGEQRSPDFRLDVQGTLNADEIRNGGAPLVESQWTTVSGGITYESGEVGIGTRISGYRLNVEGTINATEFRKNGSALVSSQWTEVSGVGIRYNGLVGLGKAPASPLRPSQWPSARKKNWHSSLSGPAKSAPHPSE